LPPLPPPELPVLKYTIDWIVGLDNSCSTRWFIQYSGTPPTNAQCNTACQSIFNALVTEFVPLMSPQVFLKAVNIQDITTTTGGEGSAGTQTQGTRTGNPLSAQAAALVNHVVQRRYRGGKPRVYLPLGTATDLANSQTWTAAFQTAVNTAWSQCIAVSIANGPTTSVGHVNVSFYEGFTSYQNPVTKRWYNLSTPRSPNAKVDPIASFNVNPRVGTQRRRVAA